MGEAKFTPGPWVLHGFDSVRDGSVRLSAAGRWSAFATVVVRIWGDSHNKPEGVANAHLIAAAPDLYEALKECEHFLRGATLHHRLETEDAALRKAVAALAKACPTPPVAATDNEGGER